MDTAPSTGTASDIARFARGGALNVVGTVSFGLLSFVLVVIITRGLGKEPAGFFFEAVALFTIASNAAELGADTGLVRMIARYRTLGRAHDVKWTLVVAIVPVAVAGIVLAAAGLVLAGPASRLFAHKGPEGSLVPYVRLLALFLPLSCVYTVATAGTRGFGTMRPSVLIDKLGRPLTQCVLALAVVAGGLGASSMAAAYGAPIGIGFVVATLWLLALERRAVAGLSDEGRAVTPVARLFWEFWRFTAPRGLAAVFQVAILWLDTLLIGALRGASDATVYTASSRYIVAGQAVLAAVVQAIAPQISSLLAAKERGRAESVYQAATAWLMVLTWPIYVMMAVFAPVLVRVFGSGYGGGATVLSILAPAMLVSMACGPVDVVLLMGGRSWWSAFNTMVALVLNVVLNLLLIPRWGIEGSAIAWTVSIVVRNVLPLIQVSRFLHLGPFGPGSRVAALASLGTFGLIGLGVRIVAGPSLVSMLAAGVVSTGLYTWIVWRRRSVLQLTTLVGAIRRRGRTPEDEAEIGSEA
jgi:O-antigen/teichoic acid export membrane protein